jgi:hypothetical protein
VEPLLDQLWAEMQKGRIYECPLLHKVEQVEGVQEGKKIYIDPRLAVLDTLVHELLHRLKPKWGERRVWKETSTVMCRFSEADKRRWWRAYRKIKKVSCPVEVED